MQKQRFWFGTAIVVVPVMLLLVALSPGFQLRRSAPVEGHVTYHGRPLAGGSILFVPEDSRHGDWALARIDRNGDFRIGSMWSRDASASKARYRICVVPPFRDRAAAPPRGSDVPTAWSGSGASVSLTSSAVPSGFPASFSDPNTTRLEVVLGSEPAHVDIAF